MAFLRPVQPQWRAPYVGRAFIADTYRGVLRVRAWPRKRGQPKQAHARANLDLHNLYLRLYSILSEVELEVMRAAIKEHNRTHVGVRGSAAIRQRDWVVQWLRGRGFGVELPDGTRLYPHGMRRDASHLLDHISDVPGSIMHKTTTDWAGAAACKEGAIFTMTTQKCWPGCCPSDAEQPEQCGDAI